MRGRKDNMEILYTGIEVEGLTYGGEYKVLRTIPRPDGTAYVVAGDNGVEIFVAPCEGQELVPMPGTEGDWGKRHWGKR